MLHYFSQKAGFSNAGFTFSELTRKRFRLLHPSHKSSHINKQAGQFVYKEVKQEDGTVTKEQVWEGAFMEGIAQSYFSILKSLAKLTTGGTRKEFMDQWTNMPYKIKENLIRGMIGFAFVGLWVTALRALFDDDEKDKVLYKLISSAMNELYFIEHAGGFGDLVTNPLPTISIFGQVGERAKIKSSTP